MQTIFFFGKFWLERKYDPGPAMLFSSSSSRWILNIMWPVPFPTNSVLPLILVVRFLRKDEVAMQPCLVLYTKLKILPLRIFILLSHPCGFFATITLRSRLWAQMARSAPCAMAVGKVAMFPSGISRDQYHLQTPWYVMAEVLGH